MMMSVKRRSILEQPPHAVLQPHHHPGTHIEAGMILRRHGDHALDDDQFARRFQRIAQRGAELGGARSRLFRRLGNGPQQQLAGIEGAGAVDHRAGTVQLLVGTDVAERRPLRRMFVADLAQHQHRARRHQRAIDLLAAGPGELGEQRAQAVVDAPLVAEVVQRGVGRHGRPAGSDDEDGIGPGGEQPRCRCIDVGIRPSVAFAGGQRYPCRPGLAGKQRLPAFVVAGRIGLDQQAEAAHAGLLHVGDQRLGNQAIGRCGAEHPARCLVRRGSRRQQRRVAGSGGADDGVDPVFGDQLLRQLRRLRRVRGVVVVEIFDAEVAGLARQQGQRVFVRQARTGGRSAGRDDDADPDLRLD